MSASILGYWGNPGSCIGDAPAAPSITAIVAGDGTLTVAVSPAVETDVVYILHGAAAPKVDLTPPSDSLKRTGTGTVIISGLSNLASRAVTAIAFANGHFSEPFNIVYGIPSDGSASEIELICRAAANQINILGLVDHEANPITAVYDLSASLDGPEAEIVVFPGEAPLEASHNQLNMGNYRFAVVMNERTETEAAETNMMNNRERIQDTFVGQRLQSRNEIYVARDVSQDVRNGALIYEQTKFISGLLFECERLRARG